MPPKKIPNVDYRLVVHYTSRGFAAPKPIAFKPDFTFERSLPGRLPSVKLEALKLAERYLSDQMSKIDRDEPPFPDLNVAIDPTMADVEGCVTYSTWWEKMKAAHDDRYNMNRAVFGFEMDEVSEFINTTLNKQS